MKVELKVLTPTATFNSAYLQDGTAENRSIKIGMVGYFGDTEEAIKDRIARQDRSMGIVNGASGYGVLWRIEEWMAYPYRRENPEDAVYPYGYGFKYFHPDLEYIAPKAKPSNRWGYNGVCSVYEDPETGETVIESLAVGRITVDPEVLATILISISELQLDAITEALGRD